MYWLHAAIVRPEHKYLHFAQWQCLSNIRQRWGLRGIRFIRSPQQLGPLKCVWYLGSQRWSPGGECLISTSPDGMCAQPTRHTPWQKPILQSLWVSLYIHFLLWIYLASPFLEGIFLTISIYQLYLIRRLILKDFCSACSIRRCHR